MDTLGHYRHRTNSYDRLWHLASLGFVNDTNRGRPGTDSARFGQFLGRVEPTPILQRRRDAESKRGGQGKKNSNHFSWQQRWTTRGHNVADRSTGSQKIWEKRRSGKARGMIK